MTDYVFLAIRTGWTLIMWTERSSYSEIIMKLMTKSFYLQQPMPFLDQKNLIVYNIFTPSSHEGHESVVRILANCQSHIWLKTVTCSFKNVLGMQMACPILEYFHNHPVDQRILKIEQDLTLFETRCSDLARLKAWSKPLKVRP